MLSDEMKILNDSRFESYYELLVRRNREFNLTAITERNEVWVKHFFDSIIAEPLIERGAHVLDVGSGAGFPGIPLKIAREDISLTMVESIRKKADFLREAVSLLSLSNTTVINARAEDLPKTTLYDVGVARAVAKTATLAEYILPFIRVGGLLIAYKAKDAELEAEEARNAFECLGARLERIVPSNLRGMERNLILVRKLSPTPAKYPRSGNKPKSSPL